MVQKLEEVKETPRNEATSVKAMLLHIIGLNVEWVITVMSFPLLVMGCQH